MSGNKLHLQEELEHSEKLKKGIHGLLRQRRKIMEAYEELERQMDSQLEQTKLWLEALPSQIEKRLEKDRTVLQLRKQILESLKRTEQ